MANDVSGFAEFADDLEEFADDLDSAADRVETEAVPEGNRRTAEAVAAVARILVPVDTGELRDSIHTRELPNGDVLVVVSADHARPVEYGSAPRTITPDTAEALRFEIDGEVVYAARVELDARPASPYLQPALDENREAHPQNILAVINEIIAEELA